jgi:hypothetical protein
MFHFVPLCGAETKMPSRSLQKQVSIFLPLEDWKRIRREAARRNVPMTELCRQWMSPGLYELRRRPPEPGFSDPDRRPA